MDIFKLIFEHDLRLDQLQGRQADRANPEVSSTLEDFLKPDPTYSKFYFTGTVLPKQKFGINTLEHWPKVLKAFLVALKEYNSYLTDGVVELGKAIDEISVGEPILFTKGNKPQWEPDLLRIDSYSNVGHKKTALADVLKTDDLVLYKEQAHNGYDLHLFSKRNIYPLFFYEYQKIVSPKFRYFSINGKKIRSERKFYFETWSLQNPPHGAEEVFKETVM